MARWATFFGVILLGILHVYVALIFSFVYFGIARVETLQLTWPQSLAISLFMPATLGRLPHGTLMTVVGGVHSLLILIVGVGSALNYFRPKLDSITQAAVALNARLSEDEIQRKLGILNRRFESQSKASTGSEAKGQESLTAPIVVSPIRDAEGNDGA